LLSNLDDKAGRHSSEAKFCRSTEEAIENVAPKVSQTLKIVINRLEGLGKL
jgi:hypothetical protein